MGDASHQSFVRSDDVTANWASAVANLRDADAQFIPIREAFARAEAAFFRLRARDGAGELGENERDAAYAAIGLEAATEQERIFGDALYAAAKACFETPVPDLAALIEKIELIELIGYDGSVEQLVLADLRRLC